MAAASVSDPKFALHRAVYKNDVEAVKVVLEDPELDLDRLDHHGNTAVQIAVQLRFGEIARILLDAGADPSIVNAQGWGCRGEAQHSQNPKIAMDVLEAGGLTFHRKFRERLPRLFKALAATPDFYMEVTWSLRTILPFLAKMAPSDHYKIWKRGTTLRLDSTVTNLTEKYRTERGHLSYILMGLDTDTPGDVVLIDHQRKEYSSALDWFKLPNMEELALMAERMMKTSAPRGDLNTEHSQIKPVEKLIGTDQKVKISSGHSCRVYEMTEVRMEMTRRVQAGAPEPTLSFDEYWGSAVAAPADGFSPFGSPDAPRDSPAPAAAASEPIVPVAAAAAAAAAAETKPKDFGCFRGDHKTTSFKRTFTPTLFMTDTFPLPVDTLLPFVDALSPSEEGYKLFETFIRTKLPPGFPVKVDVPIIPALLGAVIKFPVCQVREISPVEVAVPRAYTRVNYHDMAVNKRRVEVLRVTAKKGETKSQREMWSKLGGSSS